AVATLPHDESMFRNSMFDETRFTELTFGEPKFAECVFAKSRFAESLFDQTMDWSGGFGDGRCTDLRVKWRRVVSR
ncbi:MAG: hypothetical protein AAFN70_16965, partial [Planctomycetota bacterium]